MKTELHESKFKKICDMQELLTKQSLDSLANSIILLVNMNETMLRSELGIGIIAVGEEAVKEKAFEMADAAVTKMVEEVFMSHPELLAMADFAKGGKL